jgi:UDP-N-acetylglucosamine--N-acetylmuramyl-(pentapeptide) pyrophosphoryl-undecaprenol N-acetylglucosamine transferase
LRPLKVIISGGGTGGHIFPAIAIANALKKNYANAELLFVGALGKMEMEKVPAAGYKIIGLPVAGLQRSFTFKNLLFPFKLMSSLLKAKKIIKEFKPDVVVGVGGYASGPILYAATQKRIPTLIQEQNSFPGITNKLLAKKVDRICVAFDRMDIFFPKGKIMLTGNPVRQDILNLSGKRERGIEFFDLKSDKKTILVIGGSLGARTINESIASGIQRFVSEGVQVIWQTGKPFFERAKVEATHAEDIKVNDFISKMDLAYAVADLVISRAGASSVSELSLVSKPCILVPSPNVAEDHQTKNAMVLVNRDAAILVKDVEARERLGSTAIELIKNEDRLEKLSLNITSLGLKNSADAIANEIFHLANSK